jgi:hypothetical protein
MKRLRFIPSFKRSSILFVLKILFILILVPDVAAQDTLVPANEVNTTVIERHSAHKATIYSLILPGLGQAYNKKYWKIPIIYAGFGALAYNISINSKEEKKFTEAYRYKINGDTFPINNEYVVRYSDPNDLLRGRDFYRRRVELSVIFTAALYILNVVDAAVDAHFFDYDVSEDLSLNIQPIMIKTPQQPYGTGGIRLCLNF